MLDMDITIDGLEEQLDLLRAEPRIIDKRMRQSMNRATNAISSQILPMVPVVTGKVKENLRRQTKSDGFGSVTGRFYSRQPFFLKVGVERGRQPGKMPSPASGRLLAWMEKVLGTRDPGVAFRIARSIGQKGTQGRHVMEEGFKATKSKVDAAFTWGLKMITKDMARKSNGR